MGKRVGFLAFLFLTSGVLLFGQASASINGRVTDQQGAVIPNAAVTVTNAAGGVLRSTVTNTEGLYNVPALVPGTYDIKSELQGFSTTERKGVELLTGASLSIDLQMSLGAVRQTISVEAQAALVESTQATQGGSIRPAEVAELPMLNRSMAAMMNLIPGAREVAGTVSAHGASSNWVSIGGGGGTNYDTLVDGIEDKEDQCGGTMIAYNLDSVLEFKTLTNGANAEYGRGTGQVLIATKSGTNAIHGTAFGYYRNQNLIRTDYFSDPAHGGLGKPPFLRNQFGGSFGGPIIKDKLFYFGSLEYIKQDYNVSRTGAQIGLLNTLATALPSLGIVVNGSIPQPSRDWLYMGKVNWQPTSNHSVFFRWSGENGSIQNDFSGNTAINLSWEPYQDKNIQFLMNGATGESWVINPTTVNSFTAQWISFKHDNQYPHCPLNIPSLGPDSCLGESLAFPSLSSGISYAYGDWFTRERKWNWRDDLSKQIGRHALKFGIDYTYLPTYGGFFAGGSPGTISFFADPSTIVGNTTGQFPQGFATPGIIRSITEYSVAVNGGGQSVGTYYSKDNWTLGLYAQDDFKVSTNLTLNLGLRWDAFSLFNSAANRAQNVAYLALKAIGSPFGALPNLPSLTDFQPRVGIAWDPRGNAKDVIRISYGIFYADQIKNTTYQRDYLSPPQTGIYYAQTIIDPAIGQGQLANFIFGQTALPAVPPITKTLVPGLNTAGYWYDSRHTKDAETQQYHAGWSHALGSGSVLSVDHTDILGYNLWRTLDVNPLISGVRPLASAFQSVLGSSSLMGPVYITSAVDHSLYDETVVHFERRFSTRASFQVNYILAWSKAMGGSADGTIRTAAQYPQTPSATGGYIYAPYEYGPTSYDERHRVTASGVFNLPFRIEVAPTLTAATARPYSIFRAPNPSGDGSLQVLNANGQPVGLNSQRGNPLFMLSARVARNFRWGTDGRFNVSPFAEFYNITDKANFGANYGTAAYAPATFEKPTGYIGGFGAVSTLPNSFQVQFGGRFSF
jgi:hypothetical protein